MTDRERGYYEYCCTVCGTTNNSSTVHAGTAYDGGEHCGKPMRCTRWVPTGMTNEERARKWLTEEGCFCPIAIPADEDTVTSLAALLDEVRAEVLREVIASEAPPLRPREG